MPSFLSRVVSACLCLLKTAFLFLYCLSMVEKKLLSRVIFYSRKAHLSLVRERVLVGGDHVLEGVFFPATPEHSQDALIDIIVVFTEEAVRSVALVAVVLDPVLKVHVGGIQLSKKAFYLPFHCIFLLLRTPISSMPYCCISFWK